MKTFVKETNFLPREVFKDFGWGNGYVVIPKGHPLHGKGYDAIHKAFPELEVNGGLTFSDTAESIKWDELPDGSEGCWVVGFDTLHSWDTLESWSKEKVIQETERLKDQLITFSKN